jgi:redox-sensing transcriptional repressor
MEIIPQPTLRRLPAYYHYFKIAAEKQLKEISTTLIAADLRLDPTQVRKDLAYTGIVGKPKVGFDVHAVIKAIETTLNWDNKNEAFLVGAGLLGKAMLKYDGFKEYGIEIIAAFDNDIDLIDTEFNNIPILNIEKLPNLIERMHINIGIITVPRQAAQEVADSLIEGGIKAIWNFAPCSLKVPDSVIIENASFTNSLGVLTRKLSETFSK